MCVLSNSHWTFVCTSWQWEAIYNAIHHGDDRPPRKKNAFCMNIGGVFGRVARRQHFDGSSPRYFGCVEIYSSHLHGTCIWLRCNVHTNSRQGKRRRLAVREAISRHGAKYEQIWAILMCDTRSRVSREICVYNRSEDSNTKRVVIRMKFQKLYDNNKITHILYGVKTVLILSSKLPEKKQEKILK